MQPDNAFRSFDDDMTAVVVGTSGGIGGALAAALDASPRVARVVRMSRTPDGPDGVSLDIGDARSIEAAAGAIAARGLAPDLIIVATGILHDGERIRPEKTWRALDAEAMQQVFAINTIGPAMFARGFLPLLPRGRKAVLAFLSARVGSISDNHLGGWHAYRASKAALNMIIRTLSIELARRNPDALCVGLHPGTVATGLSAPFRGSVPEGRLFTPEQSARHLLAVIDNLSPEDSGNVYAWDGERIAP